MLSLAENGSWFLQGCGQQRVQHKLIEMVFSRNSIFWGQSCALAASSCHCSLDSSRHLQRVQSKWTTVRASLHGCQRSAVGWQLSAQADGYWKAYHINLEVKLLRAWIWEQWLQAPISIKQQYFIVSPVMCRVCMCVCLYVHVCVRAHVNCVCIYAGVHMCECTCEFYYFNFKTDLFI